MIQDGPYTVFDYYCPVNIFTRVDWLQILPWAHLLQSRAGGGFSVPEPLSRFYMTDTFGSNTGGLVGTNDNPGIIYVRFLN